MQIAPVALFAYNRLNHLQRTVAALQANTLAEESDLFIFSDGPKGANDETEVDRVRQYIRQIIGFKSVTIHDQQVNKGLADSIISGVSKIFSKYDKVIVLEDDLVTAPLFLKYMNSALTAYEHTDSIFLISGYSPKISTPWFFKDDVYLTQRSSSCRHLNGRSRSRSLIPRLPTRSFITL